MSLLFDGVDDIVTGPAFTAGAQISVAAWIKPNSLGENSLGRIYQHGPDATQRTIFYISPTRRLEFFSGWTSTDGDWQTTSDEITLGAWQMVGVSYDHGSTSNDPILYVDGDVQLITEITAPSGSAKADGGVIYGGNRAGTDRTFDGRMAEWAFWPRILSPTEFAVVARYGPRAASGGGPAIWWRMIGSDANARDFSGNGRNGTVTGATLSTDDPPVRRRTAAWHVTSAGPPPPPPPRRPAVWPVTSEVIVRRPATDVEWLVTIGGTVRVGTRDAIVALEYLDAQEAVVKPESWAFPSAAFDAGIIDAPTITRTLASTWYGFTEIARGRVSLRNEDGRYDALWTAQGQSIVFLRYDRGTGYIARAYDGIVDAVTLTVHPDPAVVLDYVNQDLGAFDTLIPRRVATSALFGTTCPTVGEPLPYIIGTVPRVPLLYVKDDVPGAAFDYVIGEGLYSVTKVYRDRENGTQLKALVPSEFALETTRYSGLTTIRTPRRQIKEGGGFHQLYADVVGPAAIRNPAKLYEQIVSNATWGLGLPVNTSEIASAASMIPAGLVLDGVIREQRPARDYLNEILMVRGGSPTFSITRGWGLKVDAPGDASVLTLSP